MYIHSLTRMYCCEILYQVLCFMVYLRTQIYLTRHTRLIRQRYLMMKCGGSGKDYPKIFLSQMRSTREKLRQGSCPPKRDSNQGGGFRIQCNRHRTATVLVCHYYHSMIQNHIITVYLILNTLNGLLTPKDL